MDNYILAYYQGIVNGSIVVGRWIRRLYEIIVQGIDDGTYLFDQAKANRVIRFVERFAHHNKGKLAPGRLELSLWQKAALSVMFGIVEEDGARVFREVVFVVGRKCGKTLLASSVLQWMLFADGEFGVEAYCLAPKLDQAELVFSSLMFSIEQEPTLAKRIRPRKFDRFIQESNSTVKKIAFNEKKADGYNPHITVGDEFSSWPGQRGLKQYEVMVSGTGSRTQPMTLMISSGGYENEGIYDELVKRGTSFLNGNSRERRLLPFLYMIDDLNKWDDINELRKSVPGLGVSVSTQYMLDEINTAYESLSKKTEFLTKYCCVKQSSENAWLRSQDVMALTGEAISLEQLRGSYCVAGIDLSMSTDLCCACIVVEKGGLLYVVSQYFLPGARIQEAEARDGLPYQMYIQRGLLTPSGENYIDYSDVYRWLTSLVEQYEILPLAVGYDPYGANFLVKELQQYGFKCSDVKQG